jgi:hypothetical protein
VRRVWVIACVGLVGCFYVEPINQRPAIDIRADSSEPVFRGDTVVLHAVADDPEDQRVAFTWRAYLCTDATTFESCDAEPFFTGVEEDAEFVVPAIRADQVVPVEALRVLLEARDALGATAKPAQLLLISVLDHAPTVELAAMPRYGSVIATPIDIFAKYTDGDDPLDSLAVTWQVFPPNSATFTFDDLVVPPNPNDPTHRQIGKRLVPSTAGDWKVEVTAMDPLGNTTKQNTLMTVVSDQPPCLATWSPIAPAPPTTLPVTEQTLFQVPVVADDLDPYPTVLGDPFLGATTFKWSLKQGTGGRQIIPGATGNSVALDPAAFAPGTLLELRVEIADRNKTPIGCADAAQTCSVISTSCIQRQTWHLEVR